MSKGREVTKTAKWEDLKLTSSHGHTKITTTYRANIYKNNLKSNWKDVSTTKIIKKEPS